MLQQLLADPLLFASYFSTPSRLLPQWAPGQIPFLETSLTQKPYFSQRGRAWPCGRTERPQALETGSPGLTLQLCLFLAVTKDLTDQPEPISSSNQQGTTFYLQVLKGVNEPMSNEPGVQHVAGA